MKLKESILRRLEEAGGEYVSGEELAGECGVSRNAVWKAVRALEEQGFSIRSVKNRGYALSGESDALSASGIAAFLQEEYDIRVLQSTVSTNDEVKALAAAGAAEWTVVVAEEQTRGRGRYERPFFSPRGSGVYVSILLRPKLPANETLFITTCAAVAVCEAIGRVAGKDAKIKWVNDVFLGGKKVCGILTEASFDVESGGLAYAVVGIGINVNPCEYPEPLRSVATSVFSQGETFAGARARIAAALLERFRYYYERIHGRDFYPVYKNRLLGIGAHVQVVSGSLTGEAEVLDLNENCFLIVRFADGTIRKLSSGEVSIRL